MTSMSASVRQVRQQCEDACAHDRHAQLPLVLRAGARDAARKHLRALRHEARQQLDVLVVDVVDLVRAELADLASTEERPALTLTGLVAAAGCATATSGTGFLGSKWHDYTSAPSRPSIPSSSFCCGRSDGSGRGGRPRATRRRSWNV